MHKVEKKVKGTSKCAPFLTGVSPVGRFAHYVFILFFMVRQVNVISECFELLQTMERVMLCA